MGNKPDKKQIKSHIKQTQDIDRRIKASLDGEREELIQLRKAADQFLNARIQASLEAMDVEMLTQGKQKIRVSYLRSAGIQNMWQLSKMSRQQIEDLDGVGAQGASVNQIIFLFHNPLSPCFKRFLTGQLLSYQL